MKKNLPQVLPKKDHQAGILTYVTNFAGSHFVVLAGSNGELSVKEQIKATKITSSHAKYLT
jgi:hypothetical protein